MLFLYNFNIVVYSKEFIIIFYICSYYMFLKFVYNEILIFIECWFWMFEFYI